LSHCPWHLEDSQNTVAELHWLSALVKTGNMVSPIHALPLKN
jgi:hypothetical protein